VIKKTKYFRILFVGMIIILFSIFLYIKNSPYWYFPAPIGVWLFFDSISYFRKNKTTLDLITKKDYKKFLKFYIALFIGGILIELIGSIFLNLWSYKLSAYTSTLKAVIGHILNNPLSGTGWFIYPFILMSFKGMYEFLKSFFKNKISPTILAMLLGIIIWEIPNVFSQDWIYRIPFISLEIFGVNIIIILAWVILIQGPLLIYRFIDNLK
jgi:hypothetical protein